MWCGSPGLQTAQVSKHDSYDKQLLAKLAIAALEDRAHDCAHNHGHDLAPSFKPLRLSPSLVDFILAMWGFNFHYQDRDLGVSHNLFGNGPEHQPCKTAAAVRG